MKIMKHMLSYFRLVILILMVAVNSLFAQTAKVKKILVIGVDGVIHSALDYATTPGVDRLVDNATYSMNGYGGVPAYASTGWATMMTGVSVDKHGVNQNHTFTGNRFNQYPSMVSRIKSALPGLPIASVVRDAQLNELLNHAADHKFHYATDEEVYQKSSQLLSQADIGAVFTQFSSAKEIGEDLGFQLREAQYVLAIQKIDSYVAGLQSIIQSRESYADENWAIFLVSTHGGSESGIYTNRSREEINVPVIFSGDDLDNKELIASAMAAKENGNNVLTVNKSPTGETTYVRIPIKGTPLQGMNKFTIEMWVKAGNNSSDPAIMGDKNWNSGSNPGFIICRSGSSWKINFANHKKERYDINSTMTLEDQQWHHLAVTFDKTKECIVYQDGQKVAEAALLYKADDDMTSPYDYINLAQEGTGTYDGGGTNWAGSFNDVKIWTDVLSQETISNYMYLPDIEKSDHPNLAALNLYLKMDEARGTFIKDSSGKGHHAQLIGPAVERYPYYPIELTDVSTNVFVHLGIAIDGSWGLEGVALKSNVPFRLFKVN